MPQSSQIIPIEINSEKTQNDNYDTKVLSDVPSIKEQKAKISLEQNIDRA